MINSISFEHYRGFKEKQKIELAKRESFTFLVGANNSGKSLISRGLLMIREFDFDHLGEIKRADSISDKEYHFYDDTTPIVITIVFSGTISELPQYRTFSYLSEYDEVSLSCFIFKTKEKKYTKQAILLNIAGFDTHILNIDQENVDSSPQFQKELGIDLETAKRICNDLGRYLRELVLVFDPIRSFSEGQSGEGMVNGTELYRWLAENDGNSVRRDVEKATIEALIRLDLEPFQTIEVKGSKDLKLNFKKHLGLYTKDVGTGYSMILILLMELFRQKKKIVVIDEIESHLQPGLLRMLMRVIREVGKTQFIFATHSPVVVQEFQNEDILYRFQKKSGTCVVNKVAPRSNTVSNLRSLANELGVLPGDALMANCVIWVEGPSEVKWLRTWLKTYLPIYRKDRGISSFLLEGLHYSILMTGGGLIAHYSYEEGEDSVEDLEGDAFLKALRVNPNAFVIMDSDNSAEGSGKMKRIIRIARELNEQNKLTPQFSTRVKDSITNLEESKTVPNFWCFEGRELENYSHPQILKDYLVGLEAKDSSTITGASGLVDDKWKVYSKEKGIGAILEENGVSEIATASGSISTARKKSLANYIVNSFKPVHFEQSPTGLIAPQKEMISDLKYGIDKLLDYILKVNA